MSAKSRVFFIISIDMAAVVIAVLIGFAGKGTEPYFEEGGLITWISFVLLLMVAIISWRIFNLRRDQSRLKDWKQNYVLWAIIALGFLFLSVDEVARIHEGLDKLIHIIWGMEETNITDRIDSIIVGCYGLIGLWVIYWYKEEFVRYRKVLPLLISGLIFMLLMVVFDTASEKGDIKSMLIKDPAVRNMISFGNIEEAFKIFAEAVFVAVFYYCLRISKKQKLT